MALDGPQQHAVGPICRQRLRRQRPSRLTSDSSDDISLRPSSKWRRELRLRYEAARLSASVTSFPASASASAAGVPVSEPRGGGVQGEPSKDSGRGKHSRGEGAHSTPQGRIIAVAQNVDSTSLKA